MMGKGSGVGILTWISLQVVVASSQAFRAVTHRVYSPSCGKLRVIDGRVGSPTGWPLSVQSNNTAPVSGSVVNT